MTGLPQRAIKQVGRLLNGKAHPYEAEIGHLAMAAARGAESLVYLAHLDDKRFAGIWPSDGYANDCVDDGHVRWAAAGALASLDHCIAAASRLGGFAKNPPQSEDCVRTFYAVTRKGKIFDNRFRVPPPWRAWMDGVVTDNRYTRLLDVRNTLVHADAFRMIHGTTEPIAGHQYRYGYRIGSMGQPVGGAARVGAREIVELSRDIAVDHVTAFVEVLEALP
jgi:hypothetical protein